MSPGPGDVEVRVAADAVITFGQVVAFGVSIGGAATAGAFGILKWSLGRNIAAMDETMTEMKADIKDLSAKFDTLYQRQENLQLQATTKADCTACRRDCQDRVAQNQREMLEWMRRQDDKLDRIVMMMANAHNGLGGVTNGLPKRG